MCQSTDICQALFPAVWIDVPQLVFPVYVDSAVLLRNNQFRIFVMLSMKVIK